MISFTPPERGPPIRSTERRPSRATMTLLDSTTTTRDGRRRNSLLLPRASPRAQSEVPSKAGPADNPNLCSIVNSRASRDAALGNRRHSYRAAHRQAQLTRDPRTLQDTCGQTAVSAGLGTEPPPAFSQARSTSNCYRHAARFRSLRGFGRNRRRRLRLSRRTRDASLCSTRILRGGEPGSAATGTQANRHPRRRCRRL
jgi:hypothetical protein